MKTLSVFLLLIFAYNGAFAQKELYVRYNALTNKAQLAGMNKNYSKAMQYYDQAFKIIDWKAYDYFDAMIDALKARDTARAEKYVLTGIRKGLYIRSYYEPDFIQYVNTPRGKVIKEEYDSLHAIATSSINKEYFARLLELKESDQHVRHENPGQMMKVDSINFQKLLNLVTEFGFPTYKNVGWEGFGMAWLLLWHHRDEYPNTVTWHDILPYIQKEIDAGNIEPSYLCMFVDFSCYLNGKPEKYGTLLGYFRNKTEDIKLSPKKEINQNRAAVGLEPIEDFARKIDLDLNKIDKGDWLKQK